MGAQENDLKSYLNAGKKNPQRHLMAVFTS
jgi:hypothetical protein